MNNTKIILTGFAGIMIMAAANAASTLATEPFVRSAVDYAVTTSKDYTDAALTDLAAGEITLTGYATETYADAAETDAINAAKTYTDTAVTGKADKTQVGSDTLTTTATTITGAINELDTDITNKANKQVAGAEEVALVGTDGQYVRSGVTAASLSAMAGDISGKADVVATGVGTGTKVTVNAQGIVTATTDAGIADITGLSTALDNKQDSLTLGAANTVMLSNGTGYEWVAITGDTFTPIVTP